MNPSTIGPTFSRKITSSIRYHRNDCRHKASFVERAFLSRRTKMEIDRIRFRGSCTDEKLLTVKDEFLEARRCIRDNVWWPLRRTYAGIVDETTNTAHEQGTERGTAHAESSATGTHRGPRCPARKRHRRIDVRNAQGAFERHLRRLEVGSGRKSEPVARGKKRCAHDAGSTSDKERQKERKRGGRKEEVVKRRKGERGRREREGERERSHHENRVVACQPMVPDQPDRYTLFSRVPSLPLSFSFSFSLPLSR